MKLLEVPVPHSWQRHWRHITTRPLRAWSCGLKEDNTSTIWRRYICITVQYLVTYRGVCLVFMRCKTFPYNAQGRAISLRQLSALLSVSVRYSSLLVTTGYYGRWLVRNNYYRYPRKLIPNVSDIRKSNQRCDRQTNSRKTANDELEARAHVRRRSVRFRSRHSRLSSPTSCVRGIPPRKVVADRFQGHACRLWFMDCCWLHLTDSWFAEVPSV